MGVDGSMRGVYLLFFRQHADETDENTQIHVPPAMSATTTHVVFVHGLWMPGFESHWFRRRLADEAALGTSVFTYRTTREPIDTILDRLQDYLDARGAATLHLVGHSLGGIVLLRLLQRLQADGRSLPPGRVVLLGTPVCGSQAAARLEAVAVGRALLGRVAADGLLRPAIGESPRELLSDWVPPREIGVIAGTSPFGLGRVIARFQEPNDGTVAVRETRYEAARDHIALPVSHMGMLLSARVVEETARFLRDGSFSLRRD
jgi:pimeloyl-ACP methyl ester carboxylesterase